MKLISLNIEFNRHLDRVKDFLQAEQADVVCLQELLQEHLPFFQEATGADVVHYAPMTRLQRHGVDDLLGVGIFSRVPVSRWQVHLLGGEGSGTEPFKAETAASKHGSTRFVALEAVLATPTGDLPLLTTHFPVTVEGGMDEFQTGVCDNFLNLVAGYPTVAACGDFNAPRGRPIFSRLAAALTDTIPAHYETSLYGPFHKAGYQLPYMVDGLFVKGRANASNVALKAGMSDHHAIVAELSLSR